jgi:hypothetical protein
MRGGDVPLLDIRGVSDLLRHFVMAGLVLAIHVLLIEVMMPAQAGIQ